MCSTALTSTITKMLRRGAMGSVASAPLVRSLAATSTTSFTLPELPYDVAALEPAISREIMTLHHKKHHAAYVTNLNAALEKYEAAAAKGAIAEMIALQQAIRFNGGGHVNHSIFWSNLAPKSMGGGGEPDGDLRAAIDARWGNFAEFKKVMNAAAVAVQGSGWAWLGYSPASKRLEIAACANQDPLSTVGLTPLLGFDVWEHAYYLQYKNVRADYLTAIWSVVNFKDVAARYESARKA